MRRERVGPNYLVVLLLPSSRASASMVIAWAGQICNIHKYKMHERYFYFLALMGCAYGLWKSQMRKINKRNSGLIKKLYVLTYCHPEFMQNVIFMLD